MGKVPDVASLLHQRARLGLLDLRLARQPRGPPPKPASPDLLHFHFDLTRILPGILFGNWGNDSLFGGLGDDTLDGGTGFNSLNAGFGFDTLYISRFFDTYNAGPGRKRIFWR